MNQKEIFFRLNQYIAINRRLRLKEDALGHFKQAEFVKVHPYEKNYGEILNDVICSPSYLSRLEQNKVTAKTHVYDLLLAKLDAEFVLRESNNKTQDYLCQRVVNLFFARVKILIRFDWKSTSIQHCSSVIVYGLQIYKQLKAY